MKHWKTSALVLLSTVVLTACGTPAQEEPVDTASQVDTTAQVDTTQTDTSSAVDTAEEEAEAGYREMLAQAEEEYEAGLLDAAGGTLALLLQNDLSAYPELEEEAVSLQENIHAEQAEAALAEQESQPEETEFAVERQSELAAEEFNKATGEDIQTADDEAIAEWLTEKEQAEAEQIEAEEDEAEEAPSEEERLQEEQETVLDSVINQLGLDPAGHEFFLVKIDEQTYQVEIRQPHAVEDVEISNMIGIFEYNMADETLEKMNPITGEFEPYTPANQSL